MSIKDSDRLAELEQAFSLFNKTSENLTKAYSSLQQQVVHLQSQLTQSNLEKRRVADRLERLLALLPAGVMVLNDDNQVIEMNASAHDILGADALGMSWEGLVEQRFTSRNDAQELVSESGSIYHLSQVALDETLGKILLIQDVTAARQLQNHVNRHQRLKSMGEMAASLAHQIRTPLSAALLYISQLEQVLTREQNDRAARFSQKALTNLKHLESLITDMLQYAKGGEVGQNPVEVSELVQHVMLQLEPVLSKSKSEALFQPNPERAWVLGDADALQTALQNLVVNATDVVKEQAVIRLAVYLKPDWVDLIVCDNGPGISADLYEKIFEPFYTSRAKGTGLGLAVVRAVAEAHGGHVWVESTEGKGSCFGLRLPRCYPQQSSERQNESS
ncbi:PAS domain-containing sensor histidine kinase [Thiomicrospira sp. ALE5]|uniref:sensor histidine kinase n=1 Tax=Thiomicrospira sp. ALE5 TaxID=748650 RepID=UPI0008E1B6C1|nr:ATP-binding protein [Thiomicrospira sp. ALE5]SFR59311.1 two-component system, sensor histidine kinase FlrB [Thiomicrospira sp. ALE5]